MNEGQEPSDRKAPGFWFYPADYERDMQLLPMAAQGLWMRMLCWMSENEMHRGFLELPTGAPMTEQDIARRAGIGVKETNRLLACMERIGTFSRDERGCLLSRRMARDTHISVVRRQAAIKRLNAVERAKHGEFAPAKPPAKAQQTPSVTASVSVSVSDTTKTEDFVDSERDPKTHTQTPVRAPNPAPSAGLNGHTSQRFEEFWNLYPRKQHQDSAARVWISIAHADDEKAIFGCLSRYLASDQVARGVIDNPENWLMDQYRDKWAGDWPPVKAKPQRETTAEIIKRSVKK